MAKIVSVYSYRGGTGKTNCIANLAAIVARCGYRVCIVDANLQSPGIHILFGLNQGTLKHTLNDYLWMHCPISGIVHDVTVVLKGQGDDRSKLYLVPASMKLGHQARILREGYDISLLQYGLRQLTIALQLDYLFVDTHSGLSEETLLAIDASDIVLFIWCPDQQDFQGIEAAVTMAHRFGVPQLLSIVNKTPTEFDVEHLTSHVKTTYGMTIAEILPHSNALLRLASRGIFALHEPTHRFTRQIESIAKKILGQ